MKKRLFLSGIGLLGALGVFAQVTLEQCMEKADANYPLIARYDIVGKTETLSLSDISKQWLPSVEAYAQAIAQNHVAAFPSALTDIMSQTGHEMKGLGKLQYKAGIDASQTIWDGGASRARRRSVEAERRESEAALDVQMYAMHEKVLSLFFAIVLTEEQMKQQENAIALIEANLRKMEAMLKEGTAMRSDVDNVKAQSLTSRQKLTEAEYALESYRRALSLYIGESLEGKTLVKPSAAMPDDLTSNRPELNLFERQTEANNSKKGEINASLMPKIGAFAQAFYGYPGLNNFESMMRRNPSFNIIAGVRASWSLTPLYTKNNTLHRIELANQSIEAERATFLFNTGIQQESERTEIEGLREVVKDDAEIVKLRKAVREAAEAQLDNGTIDTFTLLAKITDETQARLAATLHEIKLLNTIYKLKYNLNR